ncbi:MAG: tetratricopeptide repeat protein, partial [Actinomycetota bacterium]
ERSGDRMPEYEAVVGYHLEQAFRYRRELGASGPDVGALGERAAEGLAVAGRRALSRGDMAAAVSLLERATDLLPDESSQRAQLLPDLSEALMETGALARADELLTDAIRIADDAKDAGLRGHATIVRLLLMESTDPKGRSEVALRELERVIPAFEELGDHLGLARAYRLTADVHWTRARYSAAEDAVEHARRAGAAYEEAENLGLYVGAGVYGPTPVPNVVARCERILSETKGNRLVEAQALRSLAAMRAMQGRFDEARISVARAAEIMLDLGWSLRAAFTSETAGFVERLAGDLSACERELRGGFEVMEKLGEQGFLSTVAALLAHVLLDQDRLGEAEEFVAASEAAVAEDDAGTHILLESARARVLARRGMTDDAEQLLRAAVRDAEESDDVNSRADVLTHLAEVLRRAGDASAADDALMRAMDLYEAKGNVAQAETLRTHN